MSCSIRTGTSRAECLTPGQPSGRRVLEGLQYPFAVTSFGKNLYYTDWKTYVSCGSAVWGRGRPATPGLREAKPSPSPSRGDLPASEMPISLGSLVVRRRVKTREAVITWTLQEGWPVTRAS